MAGRARLNICQRTVGENTLPGYGPVIFVKRPVRTRMQGVVGAGGLKPPATRLGDSAIVVSSLLYVFAFYEDI